MSDTIDLNDPPDGAVIYRFDTWYDGLETKIKKLVFHKNRSFEELFGCLGAPFEDTWAVYEWTTSASNSWWRFVDRWSKEGLARAPAGPGQTSWMGFKKAQIEKAESRVARLRGEASIAEASLATLRRLPDVWEPPVEEAASAEQG